MLEGELVAGEDRMLSGRVWVYAMDPDSDSGISDGDIVVVGNRPDALLRVIELGAALVILSNWRRSPTRRWRRPPSAAPRSSSRRWTATSPAGW